MSEPRAAPANIYGRKWGRGIRPYLLLPKYVCVSVFVGGLVHMLVQGFLLGGPETPEEWRRRELMLAHSFVYVIVPGLLGGMVMGLVLLALHFRALIRMRWLQVKLVVVAIGVPSLHFYMRGKAVALHAALARGTADDLRGAAGLWQDLRAGTIASIVFALVVVYLGRIKPRLGQAYGRTFAKRGTGGVEPEAGAEPAGRSDCPWGPGGTTMSADAGET